MPASCRSWPASTPTPARAFVAEVLAAEPAGRLLELPQIRQLLGWYGIPLVPAEPVADLDQAIAAAGRLGWPVALKAAGAVRLHLADPAAVDRGLAVAR